MRRRVPAAAGAGAASSLEGDAEGSSATTETPGDSSRAVCVFFRLTLFGELSSRANSSCVLSGSLAAPVACAETFSAVPSVSRAEAEARRVRFTGRFGSASDGFSEKNSVMLGLFLFHGRPRRSSRRSLLLQPCFPLFTSLNQPASPPFPASPWSSDPKI